MAKAKESVLSYLRSQNRPYSAIDVVNNLHNAFGKSDVQRALDSLVAEGKVKEKVNGKQKAYVFEQSSLPDATDSDLTNLDGQLKIKEDEANKLGSKAFKAEAHLKGLSSLPVTKEVISQISELESEVSELERRLEGLKERGGDVDTVKKQVEKAKTNRDNFVKIWRQRRRIFLNVTDAILESYPKSKKNLLDEIGIETEEDLGIKIPDI